MPEFFLELFSEEIPARMQARGAEELARLVADALAPLTPTGIRTWHGPRRLALAATVSAGTPESKLSERGPRASAPEQALAGFLRKHNATRADVRQEGDYWLLEKTRPAIAAGTLIAGALPPLLRRFSWPKSMRWGGTSDFTWVRPLRRITCLLDGAVVPFDLRDGADDGHGLASGNLTEGHRFHDPGEILVHGATDWAEKLAAARVLVDAADRKARIRDGIAALAAARGLAVVDDPGLLDEVAGLVEWPVPLLGRIDAAYMDLPAEVMQVSMRVNQRYFALRTPDGKAAPFFAFVANVEATDGGAAIIAGNERVLRARFADARHFWDLDRRARLESLLPKLDHVTFHARLGSQGARARRIASLAAHIAPHVGAGPELARRAGELCKADLVTGMVGEFPELQGIMGGYYASHDNEDGYVAQAIREHYAPRGPADAVPAHPVGIAVALADKLDTLAGFFAIGEKPTGSGDPYALRRAALGIIRIVRENALRLALLPLIAAAGHGYHHHGVHPVPPGELLDFLAERLRVQLRAEGARHDILAAVFASGADDDIVRLLARTHAIADLLGTAAGASLLTAYRRAANILRIEERKDGPHDRAPDEALLREAEERDLHHALAHADPRIASALRAEDFAAAMTAMAALRAPLDRFFDKVTVNAEEPELRRNRLALLARIRATMDQVADFSRIEG
jgi:glycyl-tRNA synthetase beta chain